MSNTPTELTLKQSIKKVSHQPTLAPHRMRLDVPFSEKDQAKALGAKWDAKARTWFIAADMAMGKFSRWNPRA